MINKRGFALFTLIALSLIFLSFFVSAVPTEVVKINLPEDTNSPSTTTTTPGSTYTDITKIPLPPDKSSSSSTSDFFSNLGSNSGVKYIFGTQGSDNVIERVLASLGYSTDQKELTQERYCLISLGFSKYFTRWNIDSFKPEDSFWSKTGIFLWNIPKIVMNIIESLAGFFLLAILIGLLIKTVQKNTTSGSKSDWIYGIISIILILIIIGGLTFCGGISTLARGFGSIIIAGIITFYLIEIIGFAVEDKSSGKRPSALQWVHEKGIFKFLIIYVTIFGALFVFINAPIIKILKPLLWPLTTDFGISLLTPFALEVSNSTASIFNLSYYTDFFAISYNLYALMFLRGLILGLITFAVILAILLIISFHEIITKLMINWKLAKAQLQTQTGANRMVAGAQVLSLVGRTTEDAGQTKPKGFFGNLFKSLFG